MLGDAETLADALAPIPDDDELARQMAMLSPQAAQAISAASKPSDTVEDPWGTGDASHLSPRVPDHGTD